MPIPIRASEIGSYLYCRRAWWYRRQGMESENQAEMAAGSELHRRHGRQVLRAALLRTVGLFLFFGAFLLLLVECTARLLPPVP